MTLNEWEQKNIEVLTSREMGEWLSRRENRLLEQIQAEIYETFMTIDGGVHDKSALKCMEIIDKYR
jgi:hypothetical protein